MFEDSASALVDREQYEVIRPFLQDGEEVLWTGRPYSTRRYRPNLIVAVFMLFWLGFALFWTVGASVSGGLFGLFGIPFICVGVGMNYWLFFGQKKRIRQTVYAVTDRRALILTRTRLGIDCKAMIFANLATVELCDVREDTGSIDFSPFGAFSGRYDRRGSVQAPTSEFVMIDDVHTVYRLITERISSFGKSV